MEMIWHEDELMYEEQAVVTVCEHYFQEQARSLLFSKDGCTVEGRRSNEEYA